MKFWFTQMAKPFHGERTTNRLVKQWCSGDSEQRAFTMNRASVAGLIGCIRTSDAEKLDVGNENLNNVVPFGKFFSSDRDSTYLVVHVGDLVDGNELSGVCLLEGPDSLKNVVSYVPRSKCEKYDFPYDSSMHDSSTDDDDGNKEEFLDENGEDDENGKDDENSEDDEKNDVKVAAVIPKMLPFSYNDGKTLPHDDEYYTVITEAMRYLINYRNGNSLHIKLDENPTHWSTHLELNPTLCQDFVTQHQGNLADSVYAKLSRCWKDDKTHAGIFVQNALRKNHGEYNHKRICRESAVEGGNDDA